MTMHDHASDHHQRTLSLRTALIIIAFFVIAGFLLFSEHRAHIFGALLWLLPFSCLFLHSFMHGGHGGHGHHHGQSDAPPESVSPDAIQGKNINDQ